VAWREATSLIRGISPDAHDHNALLISDVARGGVKPGGYELRFDGTLELPGRLNVIVGRNGTGKTTLLEEMAYRLSGTGSTPSERKPPSFSKVVFVSNNAFDQGAAPRGAPHVRFIGPRPGDIRKVERVLAEASRATTERWPEVRETLFPTAASVLETIPNITNLLEEDLTQLQNVPDWAPFVTRMLEDESLSSLIVEDPKTALMEMSAGQKAMTTILAGLYRELDQQSLALLDEPENYLHPSLITRFARTLNILLEERKAFAVVATHSPIIVQETPSRFVSIVERNQNTQQFERPSFETLGESIENIDEYLFETDFGSSHWKSVLFKFAKQGLTDEEICRRLQSRELPLLAQSYLERQRQKQGQ
jgi:predicted ATPase